MQFRYRPYVVVNTERLTSLSKHQYNQVHSKGYRENNQLHLPIGPTIEIEIEIETVY